MPTAAVCRAAPLFRLWRCSTRPGRRGRAAVVRRGGDGGTLSKAPDGDCKWDFKWDFYMISIYIFIYGIAMEYKWDFNGV